MSYLAHLEMSGFTYAIMSLKGGHCHNEAKGVKTAAHSQEDSGKNSQTG